MFRILILGVTLVFTQELVEQILAELQKHPYSEVAPLVWKIQNEATHQPAPVTCPEEKK